VRFDNITVALTNFDTRATRSTDATLIATTPEGDRITWDGSVTSETRSSSGTVAIEKFGLPRFMPYALDKTEARLVTGELATIITYDVSIDAKMPVAKAMIRDTTLSNIDIAILDDPLLLLPSLTMDTATIDLIEQYAGLGEMTLTEPNVNLLRDDDGAFRLTRAWSSPEDAATLASDAGQAVFPLSRLSTAIELLYDTLFETWSCDIQQVAINEAHAAFSDQSLDDPVTAEITPAKVQLGPILAAEGYTMPFDVVTMVNDLTAVALKGRVQDAVDVLRVRIDIDDADLPTFGPYAPFHLVEELPPAAISSGRAEVHGDLVLRTNVDDVAGATWTGELTLTNVDVSRLEGGNDLFNAQRIVVDGETRIDTADDGRRGTVSFEGTTALRSTGSDLTWFAPWQGAVESADADATIHVVYSPDTELALSLTARADADGINVDGMTEDEMAIDVRALTVEGLDMSLPENVVHAERVAIDAVSYGMLINIVPDPGTEAANGGGTTGEPQRVPIRGLLLPVGIDIGTLDVTESEILVRDTAADPPMEVRASDITFNASTLRNDGATKASIMLDAQVQGSGRLEAGGELDIFREQPAGTVDVKLTTVPVLPFAPVARMYFGHEIDSGRLSVDVPLTIADDGSVGGTMEVSLDRFYLGDGVKSRLKPDVPIKLGVDLLRNSEERIRVSIGLKGNLNEPGFSLGGVIWDTFTNVLLKVATAPFTILGSIFAGDEDLDLSFIGFEPGSTAFSADAVNKLDAIAEALKDRPAMRVTATSLRFVEADRDALGERQLRRLILRRLGRSEDDPASLSDQALDSGLEELYRLRVGEGVPASREERIAALLDTVTVSNAELEDLATERLDRVTSVLIDDNGIAAERLRGTVDDAGDRKETRVIFGLQE